MTQGPPLESVGAVSAIYPAKAGGMSSAVSCESWRRWVNLAMAHGLSRIIGFDPTRMRPNKIRLIGELLAAD